MTDAVRKTSSAVDAMAENLPLVDALMEGTSAMRKAAGKFMPIWPNEDKKAYANRLAVATLFPAYQHTVKILAAKPFSKPLTYSKDVPKRLLKWCEDIDLQGRNLHVFAAGLCEDALARGHCGILVDYPKAVGVRTQADEAAAGVRPYFVHVHPGNILGWKSQRLNGAWALTQLRLLEMVTEEDGEFGEKLIEQVRVLSIGAWRIYRQSKNADGKLAWTLFDEGTTTLKAIPFVPVYGQRLGFLRSQPPLLELAHNNVKHWQSQSDQDTIMHVARVPILVLAGGDENSEITVGAGTAVKLPQGATLTFTEHTGDSIEAGAKSLKDLEDQMRQTGAELLVIKPGNTTEAQTLADNEPGMCALQRTAEGLEDALDAALQIMAAWVGEPSGGNVTVYKDFGAATLAEASAELLLKSNMAGRLSDRSYFEELQRRGIVSSDRTWDTEAERISDQQPALGNVGGDGNSE